jgi:hypothetical protein
MLQETANKFFETEVVPFHDKWEAAGHVPRELWTSAGSKGLLGVTMPEQYGGSGVRAVGVGVPCGMCSWVDVRCVPMWQPCVCVRCVRARRRVPFWWALPVYVDSRSRSWSGVFGGGGGGVFGE